MNPNAPAIWQNIITKLSTLDGDISVNVESVIENLSEDIDAKQWVIGDAINLVGTSPYWMDYFAKSARCEVSTLRSYSTTCKVWDSDTRWQMIADYPSLTFSMFKQVNSIASNPEYGRDVAIDVLKHAASNMFTVKELRHYIATEVKHNEPNKWEQIADIPAITWINIERETLNLELPDDVGLEPNKKYRVKIYEVINA